VDGKRLSRCRDPIQYILTERLDGDGALKAESDLTPGIFIIRDGGDRSEEIVSAIREQQDGYVGRRIKIDKSFSLNMIQKLFWDCPPDYGYRENLAANSR
jgi:hypothetical protein